MKTQSSVGTTSFKQTVEDFIAAKKAREENTERTRAFLAKIEKEKVEEFKKKLLTLLASANQNLQGMLSEEHGDPDFIAFLLKILNECRYSPYEDRNDIFGFQPNKKSTVIEALVMDAEVHVLAINLHEQQTKEISKDVIALAVRIVRFLVNKITKEHLQSARFVIVGREFDQFDKASYDHASFRHCDEAFTKALYKLSAVNSTYALFLEKFSHRIGS